MTEEEKKQVYYLGKAKYAYELFKNNLPFKKVYGIVEKNGKYLALQLAEDKINPFSGGGVDDGEDNITAIKREIVEEMNINVEIVQSLGFCEYFRTWHYEGKSFNVKYLVEIFKTKFVSYCNNKKIGLDGEFMANTKIIEITKQELLDNKNIKYYINLGIEFKE